MVLTTERFRAHGAEPQTFTDADIARLSYYNPVADDFLRGILTGPRNVLFDFGDFRT